MLCQRGCTCGSLHISSRSENDCHSCSHHFSVLSWDINRWALMGIKILLLPIVAGVSYEIIKILGRYDNKFTRIVAAPGMWLQYITTREPDESQIEVAIASLKAVLTESKEDDKW